MAFTSEHLVLLIEGRLWKVEQPATLVPMPGMYSNLNLHLNADHAIAGELGYDGPLYDGFMHMTDNMLGPSPMHIKYR